MDGLGHSGRYACTTQDTDFFYFLSVSNAECAESTGHGIDYQPSITNLFFFCHFCTIRQVVPTLAF